MTHLQKFLKNVRDLCKLSVAQAFKSCPKSNKSPDLVTLLWSHQGENEIVIKEAGKNTI